VKIADFLSVDITYLNHLRMPDIATETAISLEKLEASQIQGHSFETVGISHVFDARKTLSFQKDLSAFQVGAESRKNHIARFGRPGIVFNGLLYLNPHHFQPSRRYKGARHATTSGSILN